MRSFLSQLALLFCSLCWYGSVTLSSAAGFDFARYVNSTSANGQFGGYEQSVAPLVASLTLNGTVYPAGSFIVWGGALNTAVVPIDSTYATATGSVVPYIGSSSQQVGAQWSIGCAQRSGANRFYTIGTYASISQNFTGDTYFVQMSTDGVNWPNVLDAATTQAWLTRNNEDATLCVVDQNYAVYSVGQEDTWVSSNYGVTFTKVALTSARFSNRTFFAGGIYTSGSTDYIMVLGGRGAPNADDPYGYYDSNDVWQSSNGGASWVQLTAAAAWAPRDQFAWTISSGGVQVVSGGDVQGGYGGFYGDVWTSTDGINWALLTEMTSLGAQSENAIIFDSAGYLYLFGGQTSPPQYTLVSIGARSTQPLTSVTAPTPACAHRALDFARYVNSTSANGQFGGYEQSVAPLVASLTLNGTVYPAGSFIVWGGALNTAVVPIDSTYATATGSVVPYIGSSSQQVGAQWSIGCAQRSGANRFYTIGTYASISQNFTGDTYFVQMSTDGVNWPNVLDAATTQAWLTRNNEDATLCVVDQNYAVYSVGQEDTWVSSNYGVTFTKVALTSARFSNRTFFAGGIYTSGSTDYIMVLGGRGAPNADDPYGYYDSNDVWQSSNGGASWVQLTAAAAWAPRDQFAWTINSNGLQVISGGDVQGGYGGFYGDIWVSTDAISWVMLTQMTSLGAQSENAIVFDPMGYLYLFGGQTAPPSYTLVNIGARSSIPITSATPSCQSSNSTSPSSAAGFDFARYVNSTSANGQFGGYEQSVAPLVASLTLNGTVYPAGSFIVWGGALNTAVVPIDSTYATATGSVVPYIGSSSQQVGAQWSIGCAQRSGANRFYTIGTYASISQNFTGDTYFVQMSTDGVNWPNVLDAATTQAWLTRNNEDATLCVVDQNYAVYSVGQEDTWVSSNYGVTFTKVALTSARFSNRTFFAGGIYTSGSTDYIMVLGGRGAPNADDPYGYYDSNDVWQSSNGGASWVQLTAAAAWAPRDQFAWTISSGGVQVVSGGDVQGGYGGFYGDVWTSTDGINWALLTEMTSLGAQSENAIIFDSAGYLYLFGGQTSPPQYTLVSIGARSTQPLTSVTAPTPACAHRALDFARYVNSTSANGQFGGYEQSVAPLVASLTLNGTVYPAGSFIVWGGALNTAVVPIDSTYATATGSVVPYIGSSSQQVGAQWSIGCAQRSGANRFYTIGTYASISQNFTGDTYFVQMSTDGVNWPNVLDAATTQAWLTRNNEDATLCVVDQNYAVYSVGQEDTWVSSNYGVTFTKVALTSARFSNRTFFAGGIYTSGSTDYIMVLGGRGAPNADDPYGYYDSNDVWQSSNGGASWVQLTAAAAWAPRDQFAWTINSNGLQVISGGDVQGGYGGFYGDIWVSTDAISWVMLTQMTSLGAQSENAIVFDPMGYLYLFGGQTAPPSYTLVNIGARSSIPITSATPSCQSSNSTSPSSAAGFDFARYVNSTSANGQFGGYEQSVAPLVASLTLNGTVYPAGSFIVWGGALNTAVVPIDSTYATATGSVVPYIGSSSQQVGAQWSIGCAQRSGANRFYTIGTYASISQNFTGDTYFVQMSTDGVNWPNVLDAATTQAWLTRNNEDATLCVVDQNYAVYSVGQEDTWVSSNYGVTFTKVALTSARFSNRTFFAGGIYTSGSTDYIMVLGGRGAPNADDPYGYYDSNDVWQSSNGGASWVQLTAAAAWAPRDQFAWTISSGGVQVVSGGDVQGGYGGFYGDVWTSTDGINWALLTEMTSLGAQSENAIIFDSAGYLYLFGGQTSPPQYTLVSIGARSTQPLTSVTAPTPACAHRALDFARYVNSTSANGQFGGYEQSVAPLVASLTLNGTVYPAGSFIVWGGALNTAVVPIDSTYATATGSVVPYIGSSSQQVGAQWSIGCAQRSGANRFYTIGTYASISQNFTGDTYFVQMSTDGVNWPNVLDAATTQAWLTRNNEDATLCVVDQNYAVYSVGQEDTWVSSNYGVTFTKVALTSARFSNRTFFAGGIYTSGSTDYIMVLGGRGAPNADDPYGYYDSNDVWQSSNGGASWVQLTAAAAWAPRDQFAWTINSNGLQVISGGDVQGGYGGFYGDIWVSTDAISWVMLTQMTSLGAQSENAIVFDPMGYLYLFGGQTAPPSYTLVNIGARSSIPITSATPSCQSSNSTSPSSAAGFDFARYVNSTSANGQFGGYEQSVAPLVASLTLNGTVYPAGSFIVWGGALNTAVVPIDSTYATATGSVVPYIGSSSQQVGAQWSIGCAQRSGANRFYTIGTYASISQNFTGDTYFVQMSTDGVNWPNVLDAATTQAWLTRNNEDATLCVVDQNYAVYSVGQEDTWVSSNYGVTFTKVALTSARFSNRTFFAGGIYTSGSTDYIMVLGGRGAPNADDPYGYYDSNDVWQSSNGGASWVQLTAAAAWAPRDQFAWTISSGGVQVVSGGDVQGGYGGFYGDVWTSTDGINWALLTEMTSLGAQSENAIIFDSAGYLYLFGGQTSPPQYTLVSIGARSTQPLTSVTAPTPACAHRALDFARYVNSTSANGQFGGYEQSVAPLVASLTLNGTVYPAGSFIVWGGALNTAVVPIDSTYATATGSVVPYIGSSSQQVGAQWSIGCAQRSGANRFYTIGTYASISQNFTGDTYFVQMSTDGVNWPNVLDAATTQAWLTRNNEDATLCVVDQNYAVYSVGQEDTWVSSNYGVTFTKVALTSARFSNRTFFAGGIYTSGSTDYIMVLGGRGAPNADDPYGYYDSNDVWQSSNGGASWVQLTAAAAWAPRDQFAWTINSNGLQVISGGDVQGGYGGFYGDIWVSTDAISWVMLTQMTSLGAQSENAIVFDPMGYLYLFGGQTAPPSYTLVNIGARSSIPITSATPSCQSSNSTSSPSSSSSPAPSGLSSAASTAVGTSIFAPASSSISAPSSVPSPTSMTAPLASVSSSSSSSFVQQSVSSSAPSSSSATLSSSVSSSSTLVQPSIPSSSSSSSSSSPAAFIAQSSSSSTGVIVVGGSSSGLSSGATAGIVIGSVVGALLLLAICYLFFVVLSRSGDKKDAQRNRANGFESSQTGNGRNGLAEEHTTDTSQISHRYVEPADSEVELQAV